MAKFRVWRRPPLQLFAGSEVKLVDQCVVPGHMSKRQNRFPVRCDGYLIDKIFKSLLLPGRTTNVEPPPFIARSQFVQANRAVVTAGENRLIILRQGEA